MAKGVTIQFEGTENLQQIMAKLPDQYGRKLMQNIFANAARPFVNSLRSEFKGSAKKGVTTVRGKSNDVPALWAGLVRTGGNSFSYMKAYWRNFGTLNNRMSGHPFKNPRKRVSSAWKGGVAPINVVGKVWSQQASAAEQRIEADTAKVTQKFLSKYAYK